MPKEEEPMFAFQVTMQNHGSYGDAYENFTPHITVEGASSYSLSTYLSLIQKTEYAERGRPAVSKTFPPK